MLEKQLNVDIFHIENQSLSKVIEIDLLILLNSITSKIVRNILRNIEEKNSNLVLYVQNTPVSFQTIALMVNSLSNSELTPA